MSTSEVANRLVNLCREGKFDAAAEELYDTNIVSIEADGPNREVQGMDAIRGKMA
jgi:hypothetical protein